MRVERSNADTPPTQQRTLKAAGFQLNLVCRQKGAFEYSCQIRS